MALTMNITATMITDNHSQGEAGRHSVRLQQQILEPFLDRLKKEIAMKTTLIEKRAQEGRYGMTTESMILETNTHGRLLISDGWGGDALNGECYRWRQGFAIQLKADDTFAALDKNWNESMSTIATAMDGYDPERPILDWPGHAIDAIAKRHE